MRLRFAFLPLLLVTLAHAQTWEKLAAPGLTYRMEVDAALPRVVHALRFSPKSTEIKAATDVADGKVYADNPTKGRAKISEFVRKTGAIAAVNADFFPYTGRPVGLMIRSNELVSSPLPNRCCFAWGSNGCGFGFSTWKASFKSDQGEAVKIDALNRSCGPNEVVLNTETAGLALAKPGNLHVILKLVEGVVKPNSTLRAEVQTLMSETTNIPIQPGNLILTGNGSRTAALSNLKPGDQISISIHTNGLDWTKFENAVSGGPVLVKNGSIALDSVEEGFKPDFYDKRHPRTAVGRTADGDIWLVAVDGRAKISVGATLEELAAIMQRLGCVDAMNLDGGGSTTMNLLGMTVNRPSDGVEREVANAILLFGPQPAVDKGVFAIRAPENITVGANAQLTVKREDGSPLPNTEIIWSAGGNGWIDQGGLLHVLGPGSITITAEARGQRLQTTLQASEG